MVRGKKKDKPSQFVPSQMAARKLFAQRVHVHPSGMWTFADSGDLDTEPSGDRPLIAGLQGWRSLRLCVEPLGASMLPIISLVGSRGGAIDAEWSELATCDSREHEAPYFGCTCGYYVLNEPTGEWAEGIYAVRAKVTASGKVVRCETGFKAQRYRIDEMYVRPALRPLVPLLEEQFNCNVFIGYPEVKE